MYYNRVLDGMLDKYLRMMGAVLIMGPKWCGKTTTGKRHANSVLNLQNIDERESYLEWANYRPSKLLSGEKPRLIDEWLIAPVLWDAVRASVDELNETGLYILTGSTSVDESEIMHTGTGRIVRLLMRTMSLYESKESNGKISLINLFDNPNLDIDGIESDLSMEDLIFAACRGGWPASLKFENKNDQLELPYIYLNSICNNDISTVDGVKRDPLRVRSILSSYARNISTEVSNTTILNDIKTNYGDMSPNTFYSYVNALERLFVIDNVRAWNPNIRSKTAMKASFKKEFIDPSIAVAALNLNPQSLEFDLRTFGFIFETLCIRDLNTYLAPYGGNVSYFRDRYGLEVDCVVHLRDGRYGLIEFKLGRMGIEEGSKNLIKLDNLIKKNIKEKNLNLKAPSFLAIVTGGKLAYTRKDGVKVIPIGTLRP